MNKLIILLLLITLIFAEHNITNTEIIDNSIHEEKTCDIAERGCKGKIQRKPYIYEDLFKKKGNENEEYLKSFKPDSNFTDYYDFSLDEDELVSLKYARISIYPQKKFQHNTQGNFLHFYKTAYEKKLPVFFTVDSMLYVFNENINDMNIIIYEEVLIHVLKRFLESIISYAEELKETLEGNYHRLMISYAQIFYGTALDILVTGFEEYDAFPDIANSIKNNKDLADLYAENEFFIMMKKRRVDTSLMFPTPFFRKTRKLSNFYRAFRWLSIIKFDLKEDLNAIYLLGKLINDSMNSFAYNNIFSIISYLIGQDRETVNFLEVYETGKNLLRFESIQLNPDQLNELYKKIYYEVNPKIKPDLAFSSDYILYSKEAVEKLSMLRQHTSFLFTGPYNIEDWTINKLLDFTEKKQRFIINSLEIPTVIHQCKIYKKYLFEKYEGKTHNQYDRNLPLRDGVDIKENFEKAKYSIKHSMQKNASSWRRNLLNNFHLLLFKSSRGKIKSNDPLFKSPHYQEKVFHTAYAGLIHFKQEYEILNRIITSPNQTGDIPEVVLEPNLEFYEEMTKFFDIYKNRVSTFILMAENYLRLNYGSIRSSLVDKFNDIDSVITFIKKNINLQEKGLLTSDDKKELTKIIYFDKIVKKWDGWYLKLFPKDNKNLFTYKVYTSRVYTANPIDKFHFNGAIIYNGMKFPDIGILVKKDSENNEKLLLYSSYSGFEFIKPMTEKIKFDDVYKNIMERNY